MRTMLYARRIEEEGACQGRGNADETWLVIEGRDEWTGRDGHQAKNRAYQKVNPEKRRGLILGDRYALNHGSRKAKVTEDRKYSNDSGHHADQAKVLWGKQSRHDHERAGS